MNNSNLTIEQIDSMLLIVSDTLQEMAARKETCLKEIETIDKRINKSASSLRTLERIRQKMRESENAIILQELVAKGPLKLKNF